MVLKESSPRLLQVRKDSSEIIRALISGYQNSLLNTVFSGLAGQRDKYRGHNYMGHNYVGHND